MINHIVLIQFPCSFPKQVRPRDYQGPEVEAIELSRSDKENIVRVYSEVAKSVGTLNDSRTPGDRTDAKPVATNEQGSIVPDDGGTIRELTVKDKADVMKYLSPLSKHEIKTLGMLLGLYDATVMNDFDTPIKKYYLDSILTAWFNEKDGVTENGTPSWNVLEHSLKDELLGHNGIARKIRKERL
jgi:hypothetical protein